MTAEVTALILSLTLGLTTAPADSAKLKVRAVSLFTIGKSQNKNQVQYAVHVDSQCAPVGVTPIFAYWRMLEIGPTRLEPLLPRELSAYGPASQLVAARGADGGKVRLVLRALHNRPVLVEIRRATSGACQALSTVKIAGSPAHLFNVYVKLTWHMSVDYLLLRGWSLDTSRVLSEKLRP